MVRAILADQKTVTRRVVKFPAAMEARGIRRDLLCYTPGGPRWREYEAQLAAKDPDAWGFDAWPAGLCVPCNDETCQHLPCPYGAAGDALWVREAWAAWFRDDVAGEFDWKLTPKANRTQENRTRLAYRATEPDAADRWVTPLFMPRWASRLSLDVVSVGVERLQDITPEDAAREGVAHWWDSLTYGESKSIGDLWTDIAVAHGWEKTAPDYRGLFGALWCEINGRASWASNPWVWRVEFRRGEGR